MYAFAQTIIQLYNQLQEKGYSQGDLLFVKKTYDLAIQLFSGRFQENGKEFISHCVGTASILASLGQSVDIVATGLIHNVYWTGDFGDGERGITRKKQLYIRQTLGSNVENLVSCFNSFQWGEKFFPRIHASLAAMTQLDQTIVLLYLADNVEHNLNFGSTYYSAQERSSYCPSNGNLMIEMANILGFPFLAQHLEAVQRQNAEIQIPQEFHSTHRRGFLIPKSLTKRWLLIGHKYWKDGLQRFRYRVSSHLRPLRKVVKKVKNRFGFVQ